MDLPQKMQSSSQWCSEIGVPRKWWNQQISPSTSFKWAAAHRCHLLQPGQEWPDILSFSTSTLMNVATWHTQMGGFTVGIQLDSTVICLRYNIVLNHFNGDRMKTVEWMSLFQSWPPIIRQNSAWSLHHQTQRVWKRSPCFFLFFFFRPPQGRGIVMAIAPYLCGVQMGYCHDIRYYAI